MTRKAPPARTLLGTPDLNQIRRQAKELLDAFVAGEPGAVAEVLAYHRGAESATFALHDAQLALARSYGFDSWPKLEARVEGVTAKRLADAVRGGHLDRVRAMLEARPELVHMDMAEGNEHRALHYAVLDRKPEMVRVLMEHGADARKGIYPHRDATGALTIASERGYDDIVAIIQEEEERRRREARPATTPQIAAPVLLLEVFEAIRNGDGPLAIAILKAHPTLTNASDPDGWTPLHVAAAALNQLVAAWLVDHGADANARGKWRTTPLEIVGCRRHECQTSPWGVEKVGSAAQIASMAGLLRLAGAEMTPVSAVALGEGDWLRAHTERALHLNLIVPIEHDRPDMLAMLLNLGADPDERHRMQWDDEEVYSWGGPLHVCADLGNLEMAELLLKHGADPNAEVYASSSALFRAYDQGHWALVELLKRYGGRWRAGDAGLLNLTEEARQLLAGDATTAGGLLRGAAAGGAPEIARMALEYLDWPRDDPRWHPMLEATLYPGMAKDRSGCIDVFRQVLERSDASARFAYGATILHEVVASRGGSMTAGEQVAFAMLLLDHGARLDVRDELLNSTPLAWACRWGRVELVRLFLNRGADPIEADAEPWATPRAWAEKMKHDAVVAVLREYERHSPRRTRLPDTSRPV